MNTKTYRDQTIKLADLVAEDGRLEGFTFINCQLKGRLCLPWSARRHSSNVISVAPI
jgi:hypothetical protein